MKNAMIAATNNSFKELDKAQDDFLEGTIDETEFWTMVIMIGVSRLHELNDAEENE